MSFHFIATAPQFMTPSLPRCEPSRQGSSAKIASVGSPIMAEEDMAKCSISSGRECGCPGGRHFTTLQNIRRRELRGMPSFAEVPSIICVRNDPRVPQRELPCGLHRTGPSPQTPACLRVAVTTTYCSGLAQAARVSIPISATYVPACACRDREGNGRIGGGAGLHFETRGKRSTPHKFV